MEKRVLHHSKGDLLIFIAHLLALKGKINGYVLHVFPKF